MNKKNKNLNEINLKYTPDGLFKCVNIVINLLREFVPRIMKSIFN